MAPSGRARLPLPRAHPGGGPVRLGARSHGARPSLVALARLPPPGVLSPPGRAHRRPALAPARLPLPGLVPAPVPPDAPSAPGSLPLRGAPSSSPPAPSSVPLGAVASPPGSPAPCPSATSPPPRPPHAHPRPARTPARQSPLAPTRAPARRSPPARRDLPRTPRSPPRRGPCATRPRHDATSARAAAVPLCGATPCPRLGPGVCATRSRHVGVALRARVLAWCAWRLGAVSRAHNTTRSALPRSRRARLPLNVPVYP
eukprot:XP_008653760.2 vegetative cell wall protein gp1 [Zea mays]